MDKAVFEKFYNNRYGGQIRWYGDKAAKNKKIYHLFQWGVIVLSSALPVLIASIPASHSYITIVMAILLAIGTAGLKTFKFQETWISYRTIAETLKKEEYFYHSGSGPYKGVADNEELFMERVESLISKENTIWVINHMQKDEESKS